MARMVAERSDIVPILAEIFRENGFEGASLALISEKTGLGKGSLYHFFPGGKEEMAAAVLTDIDAWFEKNIYQPLRELVDPRRSIADMCRSVVDYFHSGRRVCLVGVFALDNVRDRFAEKIRNYFAAWTEALAGALERAECVPATARHRAEEAIANIQGALVLSRALNDTTVFERALARIEAQLLSAV
jgi:TetR/AcrR family transcriptional regulator, lmrAB and yxaGH operons repressor